MCFFLSTARSCKSGVWGSPKCFTLLKHTASETTFTGFPPKGQRQLQLWIRQRKAPARRRGAEDPPRSRCPGVAVGPRRSPAPSLPQVHGGRGLVAGDVRQRAGPGEPAAAAVPAAPRGDALHRPRRGRLDGRVPAPVPPAPLGLQRPGAGAAPPRPRPAAQ